MAVTVPEGLEPGPAGEALMEDLAEDDSASLSETELRSIGMDVAQHGERLDRALADTVPEFSRYFRRASSG